MRSPELHDAVKELVTGFADLLSRELEDGADLPFEVLESGDHPGRSGRTRRGPVLYRYRPLTATFIRERWPRARELEAHARAVTALGPGGGPYLRHRGLHGADADDALRDVVERLFEDATSFAVSEERFTRIYAELDTTLDEGTVKVSVVAPLEGIRLASARVDLGDGVALVRRASLAAPPSGLEDGVPAAESTAEADEGATLDPSPLDVFCVLERELPPAAALPVEEARVSFRRVLTCLRLCGAGGTALGPLAWARAGSGAWHPVALGISARSRPDSWELLHSEEPELRDLVRIVARSRHGAGVGWALSRFEMGCERQLETEALSDHLLGLRALLASPDELWEEEAATRLAALCAADAERDEVRERVRQAFALERRLAYGLGEGAPALDSPRALVREIEQHLRALLRDVLCGYLDDDLRVLADRLRADTGQALDDSGEIRVRDTRERTEEDTAEFEVVVVGEPPPPGCA